MTFAAGLSTITGRIRTIESLLTSRTGERASATAVEHAEGPLDRMNGFDAFGTAYQQALVGVGASPASVVTGNAPVVTSPGATSAGVASTGATPLNPAMDASSIANSHLLAGLATRRPTTAVAAVAGPSAGFAATVGQIGGYGAMPVPGDLTAYGNGTVPHDALEPIGQGGHRLYGPAAASWKSMVDAAALDGIDLTVTDSYRSYDNQVDLAERKGLYANGGLAATPGKSNHGWGLAVDANVNDPATLAWLRANGHSHGFVEAVKREPWHWEYRPDQA